MGKINGLRVFGLTCSRAPSAVASGGMIACASLENASAFGLERRKYE